MADKKKRAPGAVLDKVFDAAKGAADEVVNKADRYLEGEYDPKAETKKVLVKGTTTLILVLSLLSGAAFSGPADINQDTAGSQINQPPIVMDIDDYASTTVDDDDDDADEQKTAKAGVVAKFRQAVLSLPSPVRLILITPLWAIGTAIMTAVSWLWGVIFSSPIGAFIASFAIGFAVLFGLFAVTAKMIFPNIPLRRLLSKRNILILAGTALTLSIIDALAPMYWHQYPLIAAAVKVLLAAVIMAIIFYRINKLIGKGKYMNLPSPVA